MATTLTESNQEYIPKALEEVECMICGEKTFKTHEIFGNKDQYRYVECSRCHNIYLNPRPVYDAEFTDTAYDQYGAETDSMKTSGEITDNMRVAIERYKVAIRELTKKYNKTGKILDLGCATGEFLLAARECGWDVYGIDISKPMTDHVQKDFGIPTKCGQFEDLDFSDWGEFDVIYSSHVIEHIPHPNVWMQTFYKHLKNDGILLLNIPNQFAPEKKLQRFLKHIGLRKPTWEPWRTPDHLYEPHIESIKYLVNHNKFKILDLYTYSSREKEDENFFNHLFHKNLKWGSKIRLFAKKQS